MKLVKSIQSHLLIFYFVGQGSLVYSKGDERATSSFKKSCIRCIPATLSLIVNIYVAIEAVIKQHAYALYYNRTVSVVTYLVIIGAILTNVAVISQVICHRNDLNRLLHKSDTILDYLKNKLKLNVSLDAFKRQYLQKVSIIYTIYLVTVFIKISIGSTKISRGVQICTLLMQSSKILSSVHVLFYIELYNNFLGLIENQAYIDENIVINGFSFFNQPKSIEMLKHWKFIHFKLWEILQLINLRFGWILIMICLVHFIDASYAVFWVFLYLQDAFRTQFLTVIRKYGF